MENKAVNIIIDYLIKTPNISDEFKNILKEQMEKINTNENIEI